MSGGLGGEVPQKILNCVRPPLRNPKKSSRDVPLKTAFSWNLRKSPGRVETYQKITPFCVPPPKRGFGGGSVSSNIFWGFRDTGLIQKVKMIKSKFLIDSQNFGQHLVNTCWLNQIWKMPILKKSAQIKRFCGLHFENPIFKLLEVVWGRSTRFWKAESLYFTIPISLKWFT